MHIFGKGDLDPFLGMERAIRAQCSEHVIMQVDDVCAQVARATDSVNDAVESALAEAFGVDPASSPRRQHRKAIATLRALLDRGAKERALQDALVESGLAALSCTVLQEVAMRPTDDYRGMRMDLIVDPPADEPTQIIELKRGSHLLLARKGEPTARLSRELEKAVAQLKRYGQRVESDVEMTAEIEQRFGIRFDRPELRLIAGRRLPDADAYHLLSVAEENASESGPQLQIYTWDGFLAELERIAG